MPAQGQAKVWKVIEVIVVARLLLWCQVEEMSVCNMSSGLQASNRRPGETTLLQIVFLL